MSEAWKKHDRPCAPCSNCGAELYEKFWGNGGWAKTDKKTDKAHGDSDCVARLRWELQMAHSALIESTPLTDEARMIRDALVSSQT